MLFPITLEPSVPYQSLSGVRGTGKPLPGWRSKRWDACIGFPSLAFPYLKSNYLRPSFHMDHPLALWPLLLLASLVNLWSLVSWSSSKEATGIYTLFLSFIFIHWRLITLQNCSVSCYTLTWISHGFTSIPRPDHPSHLPLHLIPLGLPSAPGPSICIMHSAWAGDLFHPR